MKEEGMNLTFRVNQEEYADIKKICEIEIKNVDEVVHDAITNYLEMAKKYYEY